MVWITKCVCHCRKKIKCYQFQDESFHLYLILCLVHCNRILFMVIFFHTTHCHYKEDFSSFSFTQNVKDSSGENRNRKSLSGKWLVPFHYRQTDLFSVLPCDSVKFIVRQLAVCLLIKLAVMYMLCSHWQTFNFFANGTVAYLNRKMSFLFRKIAFHGVNNGIMDAIKLYDFHLFCSVVVFFFLRSLFIFIILSVDIFATLKYAALCLLTVA